MKTISTNLGSTYEGNISLVNKWMGAKWRFLSVSTQSTHDYVTISKYLTKTCTILKIYFNVLIFIDPIVSVEIMAASIPLIDQPLVLQCTATTVGNITSTVDIIWTTGNTQVRRVNNVTASSNINSSSIYNDSFIIPSLNVSDNGSVYECEVVINSVLPTRAKTDFTVSITGTYVLLRTF